MSICRVFLGRADTPDAVKRMIRYIADPGKNAWQGSQIKLPDRMKGWMMPVDVDNPDAVFYCLMAPHHAYADVRKGSRLLYHILMDFDGLLTPEQAVELGWQIAAWFRQYDVQYLQGLHSIKYGKNGLDPVFWPHVHWLVSTRMLDGSGRKFHLDKAKLRSLKLFANEVLAVNGLPLIVMRKV